MAKHGKRYRAVRVKKPVGVVTLEEAITFVKANASAKFDETMELGIRLGIDLRKSENVVRGTVALPHGTGKAVRILVFAEGAAADAARTAGADIVGGDELIEKVKGGWTEFDIAIATPDAMKKVRNLGRVLGPRGLMPNPKTGTVTDDTAAAVTLSRAGKVEFRMDKNGNVNVPFGKRSFDVAKLKENAESVIHGVRNEKPAGSKGIFLKTCTVSSTMGVGLRVDIHD